MTVACCILTGIFYLLLRYNRLLSRFGTSIVLAVASVALIRFLIPIEFPFTKSVYIYRIYPPVYRFFHSELIRIGGNSFNLYQILLGISIIGSIVLLIGSAVKYVQIYKFCENCDSVKDEHIDQALTQVCAEMKKNKRFHVVECNFITTPQIFGIHKSFILIPAADHDIKNWRPILKHELIHYYHGHLLYNILCNIMCCLYWWNPLVYLFRKLMRHLMEMDVDNTITRSGSREEVYDYLLCLSTVAAKQAENNMQNPWSASFALKKPTFFKKRSELLLESIKCERKPFMWSTLFLGLVMCSFLLISIFVIFEPSSRHEELFNETEHRNLWDFSEEGCFLLKNESGSYTIYVDWKIFEQNIKFPIDDPDIRIYVNLEEAYEKESQK